MKHLDVSKCKIVTFHFTVIFVCALQHVVFLIHTQPYDPLCHITNL